MKLTRNVEPWERVVSIAAGVPLIIWGLRQRRGGPALAALGAGLAARGVSGYCPVNAAIGRGGDQDDTRVALGGSGGIRIHEAVTIARPANELFEFWRQPHNLSRFMKHIERVDSLGEGRTHWVARGPGHRRYEWDAEIVNEIENELIGWRSLPGADVVSAGSVAFRPRPDLSTEVVVTLQYDPPGGKPAAALAWLLGQSPSSEVREDLRRLKQMLETNEAPTTEGQPSGRRRRLSLAKAVGA